MYAAPASRRPLSALGGLIALAGAVSLAGPAADMQGLAEVQRHMTWCLGGEAGSPIAATFLGHCAACWGVLALALTGAALLVRARRPA